MLYRNSIVFSFLLFFSFGVSSQTFEELLIEGEQKALEWETEEALELLTKAIELQPNSAKAYYLRGFAASIGNPYKGSEDFLKAIELDPDYEAAYKGLSQYYSFMEDYDKAQEYEKKAIELNPDSASNLLSQGYLYMKEGKYEEAIKYFNLSIKHHDQSIEWIATSYRAEAKFQLGDYQGTVDDFEKCFDEFSIGMYTSSQYEICGDDYFELGKSKLACKNWKQAFYGLDPEFDAPSKTAEGKYNTNKCD